MADTEATVLESEPDDHPIVDVVIGLLGQDEEGRYLIAEEAQAELCAALDAYLDSPDLPAVVDAVLRLAHVLENDSASPEAAASLCDAIERDTVVGALKALVAEVRAHLDLPPVVEDGDGEAAADKGKDFQSFAQTERAKAPKAGEQPAEGSVKLDAFKAPRRV